MRRAWYVVAAALLAAGCGSKGGQGVPVNGVVTWDGQPLEGAAVSFHPTEKTEGGGGGSALTDSAGKFVIVAPKGQRPLGPGTYKVTVSKIKGVKEGQVGAVTEADTVSDLPAIYSNLAQTVLSYTVTGDGQTIEIKLDSKRKK